MCLVGIVEFEISVIFFISSNKTIRQSIQKYYTIYIANPVIFFNRENHRAPKRGAHKLYGSHEKGYL